MTNPENNSIEENEVENVNEAELPPIIPSWVLLVAAALGFFVTVFVLFTAAEFTIVGWAGIAVTVISLGVWAFMFPEELLDIVKGRALTYGGLGILVSLVMIVASVLIYNVVATQGLSRDFSERDVYSLDSEVRDVLEAMGTDPSIPQVQILGFYNATSGANRDRISVLLQDMVNNSGGKIAGYEFIDPALEPLRTETYLGENASVPAIVIAAIDEATGIVSTESFEIAARDSTGLVVSGQFQIINAILSLSVDGDFRAYFLNVAGSLDTTVTGDDGASGIVNDLDDEWTVEVLNPIVLPNPPFILNDPLASAEIMVIAGGTTPLGGTELAALDGYIQNGGDVVILADINTDGGIATALDPAFSEMLWNNFGVRFRDDLVIDPATPVRQLGRVFLVDNFGTHSVVSGLNPANDDLVLSSPHSIEISETAPAGVSVNVLVSTSDEAYAKSGLDFSRDLTEADLAFAEGDLEGVITLAVAVENVNTGSRIVLFGSTDLMSNTWREFTNIEGPEVAEASIFWASDAQNFSDVVRQLVPEPPTVDQAVFLTQQQLRWMGFVAYGVLPFGMLLLGAAVWWFRRPAHTA